LTFLPQNETLFYLKYEERGCAPGLHWNDAKSICDWPEMAGCNIVDGGSVSGSDGSTSGSGGSDQNPWAPPPTSPIEAENEIVESTPLPTNVATGDTGKLVVCCKF
jgi:hypothetical protein